MGLLEKMRGTPRSHDAGGRVEAVWNGAVVARSDSTVVVEGNHYFPPESVDWDRLAAHDKRSVCPWKGTATYFTVEAGDDRSEAAAWTYRDPKPAAGAIKDHVAFWRGVDVRAVTSEPS